MFHSKLRTLSITATISLLVVLVLDTASTAQIIPSLPFSNQQLAQLSAQPLHPELIETNKDYRFQVSPTRYVRNYGEYRDFGNAGRSGRDGRNGQHGTTPAPSSIRVIGAESIPQTYDLSGTSGGDGEDGADGEHARSCHISHLAAYSLAGADGGDGGDGGNGGNGGNGGDASIYYTDQSRLKGLVIKSSGGQGGVPGQGSEGGDGCECVEPEWVVNFCDWDIWARRDEAENSEWMRYSSVTAACSGSRRVDEREYAPPLPTTARRNMHYRMEYQGISHSKHFYCQGGQRGRKGENGQNGIDGKYGNFRLIPREAVPEELVLHTGRLSELIGRTTDLAKNVWVEKQGLRTLLHPDSNVPNRYTYLQSTVRPKYRVEWGADESPEALELDTVAIGASLELNGTEPNINFNIPGTIDYVVTRQADVDVLTVTGGFSPDRVTSFKVNNVIFSPEESKVVLTDEGNLHDLLDSTAIKITCLSKQSASGLVTNDYHERASTEFSIADSGFDKTNVEISDNIYTLDVSDVFGAWLKPNYDVAYEITIHQTTHSGAVYSQNERVAFRIPG